jgi:hypothetical protein
MDGWEYIKEIDASIASGATYSTFISILGANTIFIQVQSCATAHSLTVQVSNTSTTSAFYPLVGGTGGDTLTSLVNLSTATSGYIANIGSVAAGMKYLRLVSNIAIVNGQTIKVYNVR